jgi:hypothetical protein
VFLEKEYKQKLFGLFLPDLAYFSDAGTTYGMDGNFLFTVDSKTYKL